jgi:hypothetical protein
MVNLKKLPQKLNDLTPIQRKYYNERHRFLVITAGRRSRKTLIGQRRVLNHCIENEEQRCFLGAPTHRQSKAIFFQRLLSDTRLLRRDVSRNELVVILYNDSEIHVVGMDVPDRIEGQIWNGCHLTEFGKFKESAWDENIRPALADTQGFAVLDGVPEGRNHYYERALYSCDAVIPKTKKIYGAYHDCEQDDEWAFLTWFSSDVLTDSEIAHAQQQLDPKTFRQEYEGSFESFLGIAYYTFSEHNIDNQLARNERYPVCVGMDFNVNPMTAVLTNVIGDSVLQFGEIYLNDSNTFEMCDELMKYVNDPSQIIVFPDSTGGSDQSNATKTDLEILEQAGFEISPLITKSNPFITDRVNSMNSLIKDRGKKTRYKINAENCPKTINDFNKRERTDDGRLDKKQEKMGIGHITDALGYLVYANFPVLTNEISQTLRY